MLRQALAPTVAAQAGQSGFLLRERGREALADRIALADLAGHTLDVMYYIWRFDQAGRCLALRLMEAADRGVRVRLLLDHFPLGRNAAVAAVLGSHPGIEVRLFNPIPTHDSPLHYLRKALGFLRDWNGLNTRMHNKAFIADDCISIVGGRNIGDEYFDLRATRPFRDLDVMAVGPVVQETTGVFERFWESPWTIPATSVVQVARVPERLAKLRSNLEAEAAAASDPALTFRVADRAPGLAELGRMTERMTWAPARVAADNPRKVRHPRPDVRDQLMELLTPTRSILVEASYLVPTDEFMAVVRDLRARGVAISMTTNSLASTDVPVVHAGYGPFRKPLLEAGVVLHEWRSDNVEGESGFGARTRHGALHTKAYVIDGDTLVIGALNLDPRSILWNTELVYVIESPVLAAQVSAFIQGGHDPRRTFQVTAGWAAGQPGSGSALRWTGTSAGGALASHDRDPDASWGRRAVVALASLLPIRHLL